MSWYRCSWEDAERFLFEWCFTKTFRLLNYQRFSRKIGLHERKTEDIKMNTRLSAHEWAKWACIPYLSTLKADVLLLPYSWTMFLNRISDAMYFYTIEYIIIAGTLFLNGISDAKYLFTIVYLIDAAWNYVLEWDIRWYVFFYYRVLNCCWNYAVEGDIRCYVFLYYSISNYCWNYVLEWDIRC